MNIAITGHLNGIGKSAFDKLSKNHKVKGFDILEGYNIKKDKDKIIDETLDCNVFINNAFEGDGQLELAKTWHKVHFNNPGFFIINICSIIAEYFLDNKNFLSENLQNDSSLQAYSNFKYDLYNYSKLINRSKSLCKSISLLPTWTDTRLMDNYKNIILKNKILSTDQVSEAIIYSIDSIKNNSFISTITLSTP